MATGPPDFRKNHIISWRKIREFLQAHPEDFSAEAAFKAWYKKAEKTHFRHFGDVKNSFGGIDLVGRLIVFDIGGNKYRLIARFDHNDQVILVKYVLTHREYDSGKWKE